eukprot:CAMPEP_0176444610 /NCGR_PEP_ID=MMETSP0127-20121128/23174_1 /TAXON_ID=938130 /ORGANISM="Platyophrya macrostoma, Strain WH" /LENGTH=157 /DNA_ID=CAMNT_0017830169 /DNA_START=26 /DNA_END=495 /DNA_ORIENTATION=+
MSGKGKMGKGKKGAKKQDIEKIPPHEEKFALEIQVDVLKRKLIEEREVADKAKGAEMEIKTKYFELEKKFEEEEVTRMEIIADMTRQYKSMQEELTKENNKLKSTFEIQKQILEEKDEQIDQIKKERDSEIYKKDEEIHELNQKIVEMSTEFAEMLR